MAPHLFVDLREGRRKIKGARKYWRRICASICTRLPQCKHARLSSQGSLNRRCCIASLGKVGFPSWVIYDLFRTPKERLTTFCHDQIEISLIVLTVSIFWRRSSRPPGGRDPGNKPGSFNDRIPAVKLRVPLKMFFKKQTAGSPPQIMNDVFIFVILFRYTFSKSGFERWTMADW